MAYPDDDAIYSFSDPLSSGIDFYRADETPILSAAVNAQISSALSTNITKIAKAVCVISVDGATVTVGREILFAKVAMTASSSLSVDGLRMAVTKSDISANCSVGSINIKKTAYLAQGLSAATDISLSIIKTAYATINLSQESSIAITIKKIAQIGAVLSSISGLANVVVTRVKIASSVLAVSSDLTIAIKKIAKAISGMSISTDAATSITKTSKAVSNLTIQSSATVSFIKTAKAISGLSISTNAVTSATKTSMAKSVMSASIIVFAPKAKIFLATIRVILEELVTVRAEALKFALNNVRDSGLIRTLMLLDGKPLTNHNRSFSDNLDPIFTENKNWNNSSSRYYKSTTRAARRTFSLAWTWLPNSNAATVDGKSGRDFIQRIASDPRHHVLKIINLDDSGTTPYTETSYNVLVKDYSENLVRRDIANGNYFWDCSLSLEEV